MPTIKNTTEHAKHFPGRGPKGRDLMFPAGGTLDVTKEEADAIAEDRIGSVWIKDGELVDADAPPPVAEGEAEKPPTP